MPQFDSTYFVTQVFWLAVSFVVFYFLLSRVALPRIAEVMEQRSERIAADLEKAASLKRETDSVIEAYEAAVAKARGEAAAVMAQASHDIADLAARRQAAFASELAAKVAEAESRIGRAKDEAKAQVRDIAVDVARDITAKLTGGTPDRTLTARSVDAVLKATVKETA